MTEQKTKTKTYISNFNSRRYFKIDVGADQVNIFARTGGTEWGCEGYGDIPELHPEWYGLLALRIDHPVRFYNTNKDKYTTMLIQENETDYVYINGESRIYRFKPLADIEEYHSKIAGTEVPYPHAIDSLGNIYLFAEHVYFNSDQMGTSEDPYYRYYHLECKEPKLKAEYIHKIERLKIFPHGAIFDHNDRTV